MRTLFLISLIAFSLCEEAPLMDLHKFFGEAKKVGAKITTKICMEETKFKITRTAITPEEIIKGDDIAMKVMGEAQEDLVIKSLFVQAKFNDVNIFSDLKDQGSVELEDGDSFTYDYSASVPSFTPAGSWNIYLYLKNDKNENISCLLCHFDME